MTKTDIAIYRGLKEKFDPEVHVGFFITTDTGELLLGDQSLGQTISGWEINDGVLKLTLNTGKDIRVTFPEATETVKGLLSAADKAQLNALQANLDSKVDKVTGKSLLADSEITKLAGLPNSTELTNSIATAKAAGDNAQSDLNSHKLNKSNPHEVTKAQVGLGNVTNDAQVKRSEMGVANGVATLDADGKVPATQLPSYVDDIIDVYATYSKSDTGVLSNVTLYLDAAHTKPVTGEAGKIYQNIADGEPQYQFRWTGTIFSQTGASSLILGEVTGTAYDGAKGKANADNIAKIKGTSLSHIKDAAPVTTAADKVSINYECYEGNQYGAAGTDHTADIPAATTTKAGVMSAADKTKLENLNSKLVVADEEDVTAVDGKIKFKDRDTTNGMGYKILRLPENGILTQDMINQANTIYEIRYHFDLNGATITIPENCTLKFEGGSLANGTISGEDINVESNYEDALKVSVNGCIITKDFVVTPYSSLVDSSKISSCRNGCVIKGIVNIDGNGSYGIQLHTSMRGETRNSAIIVGELYNIGIFVKGTDNIVISNINLKKTVKESGSTGYYHYEAIRTEGSSNILIENSIINGGITFKNAEANSSAKPMHNVRVLNNIINADFSPISGGSPNYPECDVISIRGISDNFISGNTINCTNVNRVFKLSALVEDNYNTILHPVDNTIIEGNIIKSTCTRDSGQKQFIDMYIGTKNVYIRNNKIYLEQHTNCFENKTTNSYSEPFGIYIENNDIYAKNCLSLGYFPLSQKAKVKFDSNTIKWESSKTSTLLDIYNLGKLVFSNNYLEGVNDAILVPLRQRAMDVQTNNITSVAFKGEFYITGNYIKNVNDWQFCGASKVEFLNNSIVSRRTEVINLGGGLGSMLLDVSITQDNLPDFRRIVVNQDSLNNIESITIRCNRGKDRVRIIGGVGSIETADYLELPEGCYTTDKINYFLQPWHRESGSTEDRESISSSVLTVGDIFYDTSIKKQFQWDGTTWVDPAEDSIKWRTIE